MRRLAPSHSTQLPAPDAAIPEAATASAADGLCREMRRLVADRVALVTRFYAAMCHGGRDTVGIAGRLLRNQDAIGEALKPFYGVGFGDRLSSLLRDQFLVGARLVRAARAGGAAGHERARRRWQANADALAALLASENPHGSGETLSLLRSHLVRTEDAVTRFPPDAAEADPAREQRTGRMLLIAEAQSSRIVEQRPP